MEGGSTFKQCRASHVKDKKEHQCCPTEEQVDALTWDLNSGRSREGVGGWGGGGGVGICSAFTPAVRGDIDLLNCTNAPPHSVLRCKESLCTLLLYCSIKPHTSALTSACKERRGHLLYKPAVDVGKVHFVAWGPHKKVSVNQSLLAAGFDFGEEQKDFSSALPDACARQSGRGGGCCGRPW